MYITFFNSIRNSQAISAGSPTFPFIATLHYSRVHPCPLLYSTLLYLTLLYSTIENFILLKKTN